MQIIFFAPCSLFDIPYSLSLLRYFYPRSPSPPTGIPNSLFYFFGASIRISWHHRCVAHFYCIPLFSAIPGGCSHRPE